ncbi:GNAT family N-acetyltransferase [Terriglobus roseus]|uniref:Protein N-acetyltransferase, RimJ/RimL family n=1 Tax=Terriglobus roseus TaxID=392734 RepID=A0A1G7LGK8_9BACT|nr:GNAT family N-acetyltransferase [Terriglobus roseus]SDF48608.1 Protein N-acetyltransferase, RimJ/RimL family [Terriglobus roseus]
MTTTFQIETDRLLLRPLDEADRDDFAAMNADADVMTYFVSPMTREESDAAFARYTTHFQHNGFGFLAARTRSTGEFAGIIGMQVMRFAIPNLPQPAVEIGWRLNRAQQGRGFATEGARSILRSAFQEHGLPEVVAITAVSNKPSRHVMDKLGMHHDASLDFDHPNVPNGHALQRHVLYRLANPRSTTREEV